MTLHSPALTLSCLALVAAAVSAGAGGLSCRPVEERATWVHVGEIAALQGGFSTRIDAITVGAEGLIQVSRETDRDELLDLRESRADPTVLFRELGRVAAAIPPSPAGIEDEGGVIRELLPPRLRVVVGRREGEAVLWEGTVGAAPPAVLRAVALVREFAARGGAVAPPAQGVLLRAGLLPPAVARELRREGLVSKVEPEDLNPYLAACLAQPFLLVRVQGTDNPFAPFWTHYQPGRGALELSVNETVYQIRSLVDEVPAP